MQSLLYRALRVCLLSVIFISTLAFAETAVFAQAAEAEAEAAATREYAVALGFQKRKLYPQAAARWTAFIAAHPKDERLGNAHNHLAVCLLQEKKFTEAEAAFRAVIAKFPAFKSLDGAQFNLGLVLYNVAIVSKKPEDYKKAATEFAVLPVKFALSEYASDSLYYQAECLYLSGDKAASVPVYQQVISAFPQSPLLPEVYYALGTTQQELEKYPEAAAAYSAMFQKFPKHAQANECQLRLGIAEFSQKKYAEAEKIFAVSAAIPEFPFADFALFRQAQCVAELNRLPDAAVLYESLPKKFAASTYVGAALLAAGKCRYRADQFAEAQVSLAAAVPLKDAAVAPEAAYWLARTLIQFKKSAEAIVAVDPIIAAFPTSEFAPQLAFVRIDALYEQEAQQKATVALYADFAQKYPQHALAVDARYRASLAALQLQDYLAAQQQSEVFLANAALAKHPLQPEVLFIAAESYLLAAEPNFAKAEPLYQRLITEQPTHKQVPQAQLRVGFCMFSTGKHDPAIAFLTPASAAMKDPAQLAEARLLIGRCHFDAKRPQDAIVALRASVQANPQWERGDEVLLMLADSLRANNELDPAIAELNKLNQQFPKSQYRDRALHQLGEIQLGQKKYDVAVAAYRQVVAEFPKSELAPLAQYGAASALFEKADYTNSVADSTKLLTAYPQAPIALKGTYLRGLSYQRLKNHAAAIADLNAFIAGKPDEKDGLDARYALAVNQAGLQQFDPVIVTLTALLQAKPDYSDADKVYYEMAFAYLGLKREKEAADTFQLLATKLPDSPLAAESLFRVGEFHETAKTLPEAAKAYAAGLAKAKQPEIRERLQYKLGWVQFEQEAFPEATATFQAQVKEHPTGTLLGDATYLTGECLFRQKKAADALPFFATVIAAKLEKYHARSLYRSGTCTAELKQWPASEQHYKSLAQQFPKFEQINEANYGLGLALQSQNKLDEAKAVYQQVTKATNTETAAKSRFMMGECDFAAKKYQSAVEHFLESAIGYPYDEWKAMGQFEAGRCFIELKEIEKAREALETVVKKFPQHARAKDAAALLANLK